MFRKPLTSGLFSLSAVLFLHGAIVAFGMPVTEKLPILLFFTALGFMAAGIVKKRDFALFAASLAFLAAALALRRMFGGAALYANFAVYAVSVPVFLSFPLFTRTNGVHWRVFAGLYALYVAIEAAAFLGIRLLPAPAEIGCGLALLIAAILVLRLK